MASNSRENLETKVRNAMRSFGNNCLSNCSGICSFYTTCAIVFEITDKLIDGAITVEYRKGKLFIDHKKSVFDALLIFVITGCFVSLGRIYVYFCELRRITSEGSYGAENYDARSLQINALKVVFEAFPQSVIAKFYFVHCPIKKYSWGYGLTASFDFFCGAPFIFFFLSLFWYLWKRAIQRGCKMELNTGIACVMGVVISMATLGFMFAVSSLSDTYKQCR